MSAMQPRDCFAVFAARNDSNVFAARNDVNARCTSRYNLSTKT
jgi:hypothetical protein